MRIRVLITDGQRTVDLIWLIHTGKDIYYGSVGSPWKDSYHSSGKRHSKSNNGEFREIQSHHPLTQFKGQLQLCCFGFHTAIVKSNEIADFSGKKADSVLYVDSRNLPTQASVSLGLLEPGKFNEMLPVHMVADLRQILLVTTVNPWIYIELFGVPGKIIA